MVASTLCLGGRLTYNASAFDRLRTKLNKLRTPRLVRGVHYAFNGPVAQAIDTYGNLTFVDCVAVKICLFLRLPNAALEQKFRAIGDAFVQEARILENLSPKA